MKTIYFVETPDIMPDGGRIGINTGFTSIQVYEILDNIPRKLFLLDMHIDDHTTSRELIEQYLDDNGMGDEQYNIIQL